MYPLDNHIARLLLLVDTFSAKSGKLDGLTKLAKLDFLLRYPSFLEQLNRKLEIVDITWQGPRGIEQRSIDGPMIRYKFGPWDQRYYALIGGLVGRGLAEYTDGRGSVSLKSTELGNEISTELRRQDAWSEIRDRLNFLAHHYDLGGSQLKEMIYESFPEMLSQSLGVPIETGLTSD